MTSSKNNKVSSNVFEVNIFKCDSCEKKFHRSDTLTIHLRSHTGETPFKCDFCAKEFSVLSNLTVHIKRIHSEEKPYKCNFCDKTFSEYNHLKLKSHKKGTHTRTVMKTF